MQAKSYFLILSALAIASFSVTASAQSMTCKNDLVMIGDSKSSVQIKCGEPVAKDSFCKQTKPVVVTNPGSSTVVNVTPCQNVDEWTYNPGSGQFMTTLHFEDGKLKSIVYGDRVP